MDSPVLQDDFAFVEKKEQSRARHRACTREQRSPASA